MINQNYFTLVYKLFIMRSTFIILLITIVAALSSCKTSSLSVEVLKPAEITIPGNIKTLAVVNRSLPDKDSKALNIIEGVLTGEGIFVDREASQKTVAGVVNALTSSPRFKVTVPDGLNLKGTGTALFPESLPWKTVENICKNYSADAVIALETFDSDVSIHYDKEEKKRKEGDRTVTYTEHIATLDIAIEAGWKVYYPKDKKIVDQDVFTDHKYWEGTGKNDDVAAGNLPDAREAIKEAGYFAGSQYAFRISPMWVMVSRKYYKKGPEDFENARLNVKANDWEGAKEVWMRYIENADTKLAGYANYNMALYHEIQGDLEEAKKWAQKSYTQYLNKSAYQYLMQIKQRISDQERLQEQMDN